MVINIISIFMSHKDVHSFHHLKTREAANKIFVEAHLVFSDTSISLVKAHKISDLIEDEIEKLNDKKEWHITIHLDPYDDSKVQNK